MQQSVKQKENKMPPVISLDNISLNFRPRQMVLRNISLTLEAGSFTALLGMSGCGKTSLLRIIAGLQKPSQGTVSTLAKDGHIGFVFQEPTLMAWANIFENIALPLRLLHYGEADIVRRVRHMLQLVGLEGLDKSLPHSLSGGMKMRVALARALITEPQLLLMDEPFAALDEVTRMKLEDDLLAIWQTTGCTILFVTHHIAESAYLAQQVWIMAQGEIKHRLTPPALAADFTLSAQPPTDKRMTDSFMPTVNAERAQQRRNDPNYHAICREISETLLAAVEKEKRQEL